MPCWFTISTDSIAPFAPRVMFVRAKSPASRKLRSIKRGVSGSGELNRFAASAPDRQLPSDPSNIYQDAAWAGVAATIRHAAAISLVNVPSMSGQTRVRLQQPRSSTGGPRCFRPQCCQAFERRIVAIQQSIHYADWQSARQVRTLRGSAPSRSRRAGRCDDALFGRLRRLFPAITDNVQARECARVIAGWMPLPPRPPRLPRGRRREPHHRYPQRQPAGAPDRADRARRVICSMPAVGRYWVHDGRGQVPRCVPKRVRGTAPLQGSAHPRRRTAIGGLRLTPCHWRRSDVHSETN